VREFLLSFNDREIAVALWAAAFLGWCLWRPEIRRSLGGVAKALFAPKILLGLAAFAAYVALALFGLARAGWWNASLAKDTVFWTFGTGLVLLFRANKAGDEPHFFRRTALDCLKVAVVIQFVFTNYVMPLPAELVLVPFSAFLGAMLAVSNTRPEFESAAKLLSKVLTALTLALLAHSFWLLFQRAADLGKVATYQSLTIGPILTLLAIPFVYAFAVLIEYESQFIRLGIWLKDDPRLLKAAKWAVARECKLSLPRLRRLVGRFYVDLQEAETEDEARRVIQAHAKESASRNASCHWQDDLASS
jgi:hypothetical protein